MKLNYGYSFKNSYKAFTGRFKRENYTNLINTIRAVGVQVKVYHQTSTHFHIDITAHKEHNMWSKLHSLTNP